MSESAVVIPERWRFMYYPQTINIHGAEGFFLRLSDLKQVIEELGAAEAQLASLRAAVEKYFNRTMHEDTSDLDPERNYCRCGCRKDNPIHLSAHLVEQPKELENG